MPLNIQNIIHYRDYPWGFQRIEFHREKPVRQTYLPGGGQTSLIPEGSIAQMKQGIAFDQPLFNSAGHTCIKENLGRYGLVYLELQPGKILSKFSVEPAYIDTELLHGRDTIIYMFHNSGEVALFKLTATLAEDDQGLFDQLIAKPHDLALRKQAIATAQFPGYAPTIVPVYHRQRGSEENSYIFRQESDGWILAFNSSPKPFKDRLGFGSIHVLLDNPDKNIHCADVYAGQFLPDKAPDYESEVESGEPSSNAPLSFRQLGGIPGVDQRALAEIKERHIQLRRKIDKATDIGDAEAEQQFRKELRDLADYVMKVTRRGPGGDRVREIGSSAEGYRQKVTKNIENCRVFLYSEIPALAHHLESKKNGGTIQTGKYCRYDPPTDHPIPWIL